MADITTEKTDIDVSALAVQAKDDPALMLPLWESVERLVRSWAYQYTNRNYGNDTRSWETDDLIQAGYLALVDAVEKYDPDSEAKFTTYLHFHIRNHFARVLGIRTEKQRKLREMEAGALRLDAPLKDDTDTTRADLLADPNGDFAGMMIEQEALRCDITALMAEIDKLPDNERLALLLTEWKGHATKAAAAVMGLSQEEVHSEKKKAIRKVRYSKAGRLIAQERYHTRHVTLTSFKTTWTSEVEAHILWLEGRGLLDLNRTNTAIAADQ